MIQWAGWMLRAEAREFMCRARRRYEENYWLVCRWRDRYHLMVIATLERLKRESRPRR